MAHTTSSEEGLEGATPYLDEVLILDIESLDGLEEKGGEADMI